MTHRGRGSGEQWRKLIWAIIPWGHILVIFTLKTLEINGNSGTSKFPNFSLLSGLTASFYENVCCCQKTNQSCVIHNKLVIWNLHYDKKHHAFFVLNILCCWMLDVSIFGNSKFYVEREEGGNRNIDLGYFHFLMLADYLLLTISSWFQHLSLLSVCNFYLKSACLIDSPFSISVIRLSSPYFICS